MTLSAAAHIRKLAMERLARDGQFNRKDFMHDVRAMGHDYTDGQFSGALTSLLAQGTQVTRPSEGLYVLNQDRVSEKLPESLNNQINNVLDETIQALKSIGNVNLFEVTDKQIQDIQKIRQLIEAIEHLKVQ